MTHVKFQQFIDHTLRDNATEKLSDLLAWLNANGILTDVGRPYTAERGVASLVAAAWRWAANHLNDRALADRIAHRYVDRNGQYAYDQY
jgi:hypothetical protein